MNVLFGFPLAFAAFAALPILAAIYLLRNRFRDVYVSSLMLWTEQRRHRQGGLNWDRLQTPLLFVLELLTLLLLALAATGPLLRSKTEYRRLVIVLDDSFSMQAGTDTRVRDAAADALRRYLRTAAPFRATFLRAGVEPALLGQDLRTMAEASAALDGWQCLSPGADLDKAVAMAAAIGGAQSRILVITDRPFEGLEQESALEVWAMGQPLANAGFLAARRTLVDGRDRCLLTVGMFADQPKTLTLTVTSLDGAATVYENTIAVTPSEPFQVVFEPPSAMDLAAFIDEDALGVDNRVILLRPLDKPVRVAVDIGSAALKEAVLRALGAVAAVQLVTASPDVRITDGPLPASPDVRITNGLPPASPDEACWTLAIVSDPNAVAFVGPFIADRTHPLTEGLELQGVIWSAGQHPRRGTPILSAGNTPLLEEQQGALRSRHFRLNLDADRSTLTQSANWPILFWNLIHWRQQSLEGLRQSTYRQGERVVFEPSPQCQQVILVRPDGSRQVFERPVGTLTFDADRPGRYQLFADGRQHDVAVNALSAEESDLRDCRTDMRMPADQAMHFWQEYRPWDGILLLAAIMLLTLHRYVVFSQTRGGAG